MIADALQLLLEQKTDVFLDLLGENGAIDDPLLGHFAGKDELKRFATNFHQWLVERQAKVNIFRVTNGTERTVVEYVLPMRETELPVAMVAEKTGAVRLYYGTWGLFGSHRVRSPLLKIDHTLTIPDIVGKYQKALAEGDLQGILSVYTDDGYARQPSGGIYVSRGKEQIHELYGALFAFEGGIPLEHCTMTDDGTACAIEYNVVSIGKIKVPPQAGVAVYERHPNGKLAAARIYDDVDIPAQ